MADNLITAYSAIANGLTALLGEEKALAVKLTEIPEVGEQNLAALNQIITDTQNLQAQVQSLITHYTAPTLAAPLIHGVEPAEGTVLGGTAVKIDGHNFTGTNKLWFGLVPCLDFSVVDDSTIDATSPKGLAQGEVFITATNPAGTSATEGDEVSAAFGYFDPQAKDGVAVEGGEVEEDQGVQVADPISRSRW